MTDDASKESDDTSQLDVLRKRQDELRREYDDQIRWLREVASHFSDTEEQQRIVGDIDEIREKLIQVEEEIWKRENHTPSK